VNKVIERYFELVLHNAAPKLSNSSNKPRHFPFHNWIAQRSAFCFIFFYEAQNSDGHAATYHYSQQQQHASGSAAHGVHYQRILRSASRLPCTTSSALPVLDRARCAPCAS
jgi:hypothetical protein